MLLFFGTYPKQFMGLYSPVLPACIGISTLKGEIQAVNEISFHY